MKNNFFINDKQIFINFNKVYPQNEIDVLNSSYLYEIVLLFHDKLENENKSLFNYFNLYNDRKENSFQFIEFLKSIFICKNINKLESKYLIELDVISTIFEMFYDFYRTKLRLGIYYSIKDDIDKTHFIDLDIKFNNIILSLYRNIGQKLQGHKNLIYRQLNAGTNGCIQVSKIKYSIETYKALNSVNFISSIMLRTPIFIKTDSNKREGIFDETNNDLTQIFIKNEKIEEWICFPCYVGNNLAFVYIHVNFIHIGIGLSNLFELAKINDIENKKPNLIIYFGTNDYENDLKFFFDKTNNIYIGQISNKKNNDYFGYMKKMILTLHNLSKIEEMKLPIHGSMVNIKLKNGNVKNVVFIGDSGTGKSETIEMLNNIGKEHIENINVIFDDMGSFEIVDNKIKATGTEIGAFLRIDDLEKSSIYKDIDRTIFFNADQNLNARIINPINKYEKINKYYDIDFVLYADNFSKKIGINKIENFDEILDIFINAKRMAIGTTNEKGIITSFFANPFGPLQKKEKTKFLINEYFQKLYNQNVFIGVLYSNLSIENNKNIGLKLSSEKLLELILKNS